MKHNRQKNEKCLNKSECCSCVPQNVGGSFSLLRQKVWISQHLLQQADH